MAIIRSSIGANWPPTFDSVSNRLKGFAPYALRQTQDIKRLETETLDVQRQFLQATRLSVRAIVMRTLLPELRASHLFSIEAMPSIDAFLPGAVLVYLHYNSPSRRTPSFIKFQQMGALAEILQDEEQTNASEAYARMHEHGYSIRPVNPDDHLLALQLVRLYHHAYSDYLFPLNTSAVRELSTTPNLMLAAYSPEQKPVGVQVLEKAIVHVDQKPLQLIELSDSAVDGQHHHAGLLTALLFGVMDYLHTEPKSMPQFVYGEVRAGWSAVNRIMRRVGLFSYEGTLDAHVHIMADQDLPHTHGYESLHVWVANSSIAQAQD